MNAGLGHQAVLKILKKGMLTEDAGSSNLTYRLLPALMNSGSEQTFNAMLKDLSDSLYNGKFLAQPVEILFDALNILRSKNISSIDMLNFSKQLASAYKDGQEREFSKTLLVSYLKSEEKSVKNHAKKMIIDLMNCSKTLEFAKSIINDFPEEWREKEFMEIKRTPNQI